MGGVAHDSREQGRRATAGRFEAVIFDMDGVLVDSEIWWDEVRADLARAHGRPWSEEDRVAVMGQNSRQWAATMRARLGLELTEDEIEREVVAGVVARFRREGGPSIAGAVEVVRRIHRALPTALASSAHREVIAVALGALDLRDAFDVVVSADEVERGKPEPDVYLEAARRLGVPAAACLVVEDSRNGVLAGAAAGATVALVPNASIPPAPGTHESASIVLERLTDVLALLGPLTDRAALASGAGSVTAPPVATAPSVTAPPVATAPSVPAPPVATAPSVPAPPVATAPSVSARQVTTAPSAAPGPLAASPSGSRSPGEARPELPGPPIGRSRRALRYWATYVAVRAAVGCYVRLRVEGRERLPAGPAVLCFGHQCWADPFVVVAALPARPRLYFFGPKEEDMAVGARNRLMSWVGTAVPYKPGKNDLLEATRRVGAILAAGGTLAIAGEGRIHLGERELLPLSEGPAFFALRNRVPLVPIAVNGTGWLAFGRTVRVRIGEPIEPSGRPSRERVEEMTGQVSAALRALASDFPDRRPPGPFGRWLTELFNEWPEGARPEPPS